MITLQTDAGPLVLAPAPFFAATGNADVHVDAEHTGDAAIAWGVKNPHGHVRWGWSLGPVVGFTIFDVVRQAPIIHVGKAVSNGRPDGRMAFGFWDAEAVYHFKGRMLVDIDEYGDEQDYALKPIHWRVVSSKNSDRFVAFENLGGMGALGFYLESAYGAVGWGLGMPGIQGWGLVNYTQCVPRIGDPGGTGGGGVAIMTVDLATNEVTIPSLVVGTTNILAALSALGARVAALELS